MAEEENKKITTDSELQDRMGELGGSELPNVGVEKLVPEDGFGETDETLMTTTGKLLGDEETPRIDPVASTVDTTTVGTQKVPTKPDEDVGQIDKIETVFDDIQDLGPADAATGGPSYFLDAPQGELSEGAFAEGVTEELDEKATVQYQLGELMQQITAGGPLPPWASPAARKVNAVMQSRGMGASSMAAAALTTALMESGVQIAAKDADKYATIQLKGLDNKQRAVLQNAANVAQMDMNNLSARLKGEVTNAQAFLATDVKSMDNEQKSNMLTYQALTDGLFKDSAEENARLQFNAKNELQVEEYFAELTSQVETAIANREAAMTQFNVSEENAMKQFVTTINDAHEKFNANMQFAIDQSNVVWRREANTADTAAQNDANRIEAGYEFNASQNALNSMWNLMRDVASWNFQKSENLMQRQHDIATLAMQFANEEELYDKEAKDELKEKIGDFLLNWGMDWATSDDEEEEEEE